MSLLKNIPLLIDLDGVLKSGKEILPGTKEFISFLNNNSISYLILSNSTINTGKDVEEFFLKAEINVRGKIVTVVDIALDFVEKNFQNIVVFCDKNIEILFEKYINKVTPEAVLIGDIGESWNYKTMNEIFRYVYEGAEIIALHKNKFWKVNNLLTLDAGAFVSAIEYSSGKKSIVLGKPSKNYFSFALGKLGYNINSKFYMLGDDIETDIIGAKISGGKGILIYSGKTSFPLKEEYKNIPDYEVNDLFEVIDLIEKI